MWSHQYRQNPPVAVFQNPSCPEDDWSVKQSPSTPPPNRLLQPNQREHSARIPPLSQLSATKPTSFPLAIAIPPQIPRPPVLLPLKPGRKQNDFDGTVVRF